MDDIHSMETNLVVIKLLYRNLDRGSRLGVRARGALFTQYAETRSLIDWHALYKSGASMIHKVVPDDSSGVSGDDSNTILSPSGDQEGAPSYPSK